MKSVNQLLSIAVSASILAASCGGSSESGTTAVTTETVTAETVAAETATGNDSPTSTTATPAAEATTTTVPGPHELVDEHRPDINPAAAEVGGVTFTPIACQFSDFTFTGFSGNDVFDFAKDKLYVLRDTEIYAFDVANDGNTCTLSRDTTFADGGALTVELGAQSLQVTNDGLVIVGEISDLTVFDTSTGLRSNCFEARGKAALLDSGILLSVNPNVEAIQQFELTESGCNQIEDLTLGDFDTSAVSSITTSDGLLVTTSKRTEGDESWTVLSVFENDKLVWEFGSSEFPSDSFVGGQGGFFPCGTAVCFNDTTYPTLSVHNREGGHLGSLASTDLFETHSAQITEIVSDDNGGAYVIAEQSFEADDSININDENGVRIERATFFTILWFGLSN